MGTRTFIVCAVLVLLVGVVGRVTYERMDTEPAYAQSSQRLQPTEQGSGQYVFTGSGADEQRTAPFQINSQEWTITSVSSTREVDTAPVVTVLTEDGDLVSTTDDFQTRRSVFSVNADPGRFYLEITPLVDNVDYTITVQEGSTTGASDDQYDSDDGTTTTAPSEQYDGEDGGNRDLIDSGASGPGPVLTLPDGSCIPEYPHKRNGYCYN